MWQPIDTAPKDIPFLAYLKSGGIQVIRWGRNGWTNCMWQVEPTHWQPLPAAPVCEWGYPRRIHDGGSLVQPLGCRPGEFIKANSQVECPMCGKAVRHQSV